MIKKVSDALKGNSTHLNEQKVTFNACSETIACWDTGNVRVVTAADALCGPQCISIQLPVVLRPAYFPKISIKISLWFGQSSLYSLQGQENSLPPTSRLELVILQPSCLRGNGGSIPRIKAASAWSSSLNLYPVRRLRMRRAMLPLSHTYSWRRG